MVKNGEAKFYYPNGTLKKIHHFINDKLNGDFFSYDEKGEITVKGYFKEGKAIGSIYYFDNKFLFLYNERDFNGDVYYVKKYDNTTHNLIKEEGVCISPNIVIRKSNSENIQELWFFYTQPDSYVNELFVYMNSNPIKYDILKGHIIRIRINLIEHKNNEIKIFSTLKNGLYVICKDSIKYTII